MSSNTTMNATPVDAYQAQFGAPPGTQDPKAECKKWEQLCGELLAECERLRAELDRARLENVCAKWGPIPSMAEVYAQVDRETTMEQIVAELKAELESST